MLLLLEATLGNPDWKMRRRASGLTHPLYLTSTQPCLRRIFSDSDDLIMCDVIEKIHIMKRG